MTNTFELKNYLKLQGEMQLKIKGVQNLKNKVTQMNDQFTHTGYEKINGVMMRKVSIKHPSQFVLKISSQYFAQVKTRTVLQNLDRKNKSYQEVLKSINNKIIFLQKKLKKQENSYRQKQINEKFRQSNVQIIGKNDEGEEIFNIIQVNGEQEDVSNWARNDAKQQIRQRPSTNKQQTVQKQNEKFGKQEAQTTSLQSKNQKKLSKKQYEKLQKHQYQQLIKELDQNELDLLGNQQFSSSSEDQTQLPIIEEQNQLPIIAEEKANSQNLIEKVQYNKISEYISNEKNQKQSEKGKQIEKNATIENNQMKLAKGIDKKQEKTVPTKQKLVQNQIKQADLSQKQQKKPISKFKLQRMKQKLQNQIS